MSLSSPSNNLSGNRANPAVNASGKDDKNHTMVYLLSDITTHPDIRLTRGGMILIGLMSGGDYQQGGLAQCGTVISHGLAKCGFGDTLYQAANNLTREELQAFLCHWRDDVRHELYTNSQGHIGKKRPALAESIAEDFPDIDILLSYTSPITSESMGRAKNNIHLTWSKEPDLGKLAATCELYFEWGYKEAIIKRFRSVIWHSAVLRILRRAVLDLDTKCAATTNVPPRTPQKQDSSSNSVGTPSKMIAKHFSSCTLGELRGYISDCEDDEDERLIVRVHSSRTHTSTDGILEYRLEIAPAQLVRIAESGIKGLRRPDAPDEWAEEDEENSGKKQPPDPASHMRVWMPACIVSLVEPRLVEDFQEIQRRKREKTSAQTRGKPIGRSKAVASLISDDDETTVDKRRMKKRPGTSKFPRNLVINPALESGTSKEVGSGRIVRDLTDGTAKSVAGARGNLKTFFASTKPSKPIRDASSVKPASTRFVRDSPSSNRDAGTVSKHDETVTLQPPRLRSNKPFSAVVSRSLPSSELASHYLELSDSEVEGYPLHLKPLALEPARISSCENDTPFEDDPFHNTTSLPQRTPISRGRTRKKTTCSSSEPDLTDYSKKSPRKAREHTSPRSTRITVFPYQDHINDDPYKIDRSCSPSPLIPFICSTMDAASKTFHATARPMQLVDISSDSEDGGCELTKVAPLELARARARGKVHSLPGPPKRTLKDHTNYTQPTRKPSNAKCASVHQDVIDLT